MRERQFEFQGIPVNFMEDGEGFPILMVHGSGPGASTIGNWRKVLGPLSVNHKIYAMDLIGFGKSGRKPAPPYFDFPLWLAQCEAMLSVIGTEKIGFLGHSIAGSLGLKLASKDKRITKIMATGCMGTSFTPTDATMTTWTFPQNRQELERAARNLIHDPSVIDEEYLKNREGVLFSGDYREYFSEMFSGDRRSFIDQAAISSVELGNVSADVLLLHGREDKGFPLELTMWLANQLPQADVFLLGNCSHSIAFEFPDKFMALANNFFAAGPKKS